jgi:hypothetical protein
MFGLVCGAGSAVVLAAAIGVALSMGVARETIGALVIVPPILLSVAFVGALLVLLFRTSVVEVDLDEEEFLIARRSERVRLPFDRVTDIRCEQWREPRPAWYVRISANYNGRPLQVRFWVSRSQGQELTTRVQERISAKSS